MFDSDALFSPLLQVQRQETHAHLEHAATINIEMIDFQHNSKYIYTWFFENRVNESFIFFEVVLILRLSLKDTVSKLSSKRSLSFHVSSLSSPSAATCSVKKRGKKKTNAKERKRLKKLDGFWPKNYLEILISAHA